MDKVNMHTQEELQLPTGRS